MVNSLPLYTVGAAFSVLWLLGKFLTKAQLRINKSQTIIRKARFAKSRATQVAPGLSIFGLNDHDINDLLYLINKQDELQLAIFIATKKPSFIELDDFIQNLKLDFLQHLGNNPAYASEFDKIEAMNLVQLPEHPQREQFQDIARPDLRNLCEYNLYENFLIDKQFIAKFGDFLFMENFIMYDHLCRDEYSIYHIPQGNELRRLFETLTRTDMAIKGKDISIKDRLRILSEEQLKEMIVELKIDKSASNKQDAIEILNTHSSAGVLLATIYSTNDLYLLKFEERDVKKVEQEWSVYCSYAKALCATPHNEGIQTNPIENSQFISG